MTTTVTIERAASPRMWSCGRPGGCGSPSACDAAGHCCFNYGNVSQETANRETADVSEAACACYAELANA